LQLLKKQCSKMCGLQNPVLGAVLQFPVASGLFQQILHDGDLHWVTVATPPSQMAADVILYDSLNDRINIHWKKQIVSLLSTTHTSVRCLSSSVYSLRPGCLSSSIYSLHPGCLSSSGYSLHPGCLSSASTVYNPAVSSSWCSIHPGCLSSSVYGLHPGCLSSSDYSLRPSCLLSSVYSLRYALLPKQQLAFTTARVTANDHAKSAIIAQLRTVITQVKHCLPMVKNAALVELQVLNA